MVQTDASVLFARRGPPGGLTLGHDRRVTFSGTPTVLPGRRTLDPAKLRELRLERGLSRERLAAADGLSPRTIYNLEAGGVRAHYATALAIALAVDCPVVTLFRLEHAARAREERSHDDEGPGAYSGALAKSSTARTGGHHGPA